MKLVEQIQERIKHMPPGKTQGELAERLGVGRTAVNNIGAGRRDIKAQELPIILEYLELGDVFPAASGKQPVTLLPLSGVIEAGVWREADMQHVDQSRVFPAFPSERYADADQYLLEVRGESMNRHYRSGDVVYCVPLDQARLKDGKHVHVERTDSAGRVESTLKVYAETPGGIELRPDSTDARFQDAISYTDKPDASVQIRGVVIGSFRSAPG